MSDIVNGDFPKSTSQQETYLQDIINAQLGRSIDTENYPKPTTKKEAYMQAIIANQQSGSGSGQNGTTFTPTVSSAGVISWTNDGGLSNPTPVNIKGPKGDTGSTGSIGPKGDKGDIGLPGTDGTSITAIKLQQDSTGIITGGTATLSDGTSLLITIETETAE